MVSPCETDGQTDQNRSGRVASMAGCRRCHAEKTFQSSYFTYEPNVSLVRYVFRRVSPINESKQSLLAPQTSPLKTRKQVLELTHRYKSKAARRLQILIPHDPRRRSQPPGLWTLPRTLALTTLTRSDGMKKVWVGCFPRKPRSGLISSAFYSGYNSEKVTVTPWGSAPLVLVHS